MNGKDFARAGAAHRITHAGNAKHYATPSYKHTMAVPGPIEQDRQPFAWQLIAWPIALALVISMIGLMQ